MSSKLLEGLNPEQHRAVTWPRQPALILAGAGSGKTRVLTTRMAWLIETGQASPQGVMAVTFTNKAAQEMLARLSALVPVATRGMWVGTFHGLCHRLLRAHHLDAHLPTGFQIIDMQDQLAIVKRLMKTLQINEERYPPRQVQGFINGHKEEGRRAGTLGGGDFATAPLVELYRAYENQCQKEGAVDFAELLLRAVELLERQPALRDHYRQRFNFILVDEFQDTNRLQYRWIRQLSAEDAAVFAVGDDDQSIYGFRGADVGNMHAFQRDYGIRELIRLEQNYRSFGNILDAANALIALNDNRLGKKLWTRAGAGDPLRIFEAEGDMSEARFIVDEARALLSEGFALSGMAILYRSNAQSRVLEQTLFAAGVGYRVYGGLRFFERQEIRHALAYLRLVANPQDDGAMVRVMNFPPRGLGAKSLENLQAVATERGISLGEAARQGTLTGRAGAQLAGFVTMIETLATRPVSTLAERVQSMLDASGLLAHYRAEREGQDRVENLEELVAAAAAFENGDAAQTDLVGFLAHASLEAGEHEAAPGADAIQLMTVHAAKGLEFDVVFVCGLEEGLFPHENALSEADGLDEERRLAYVAVTRARRKLYLTHAQTRMLHGQTRYGVRSRFIDSIPAELCRWLSAETPLHQKGSDRFAVASTARREPTQTSPFRIGQAVSHQKFGRGVVLDIEGAGSDSRVQVNFRDFGVKWLALGFARLSAGDSC